MEEKKKVFEVRSNYYDEELGAWTIDCWFDADDNSEGEVVAYVYKDGGFVAWRNELYKGDQMVEEEIANLMEREGLKPYKKFSDLEIVGKTRSARFSSILHILSYIVLILGMFVALIEENLYYFVGGFGGWIAFMSWSIIVKGFEVYIENNERKEDNDSNNK